MSENFHHSHRILNGFRRLVSAIHVSSRSTEKQFGISAAQLFALQKLQDGCQRSLNELATLTYTHQSSVSVVVRKLVEKGFIKSHPAAEDSRRLMLTLSAQGRDLLERASIAPQDRLLQALATMHEADQETLGRLLNELLDRAQMLDPDPKLFFEDEDPTQPRELS